MQFMRNSRPLSRIQSSVGEYYMTIKKTTPFKTYVNTSIIAKMKRIISIFILSHCIKCHN